MDSVHQTRAAGAIEQGRGSPIAPVLDDVLIIVGRVLLAVPFIYSGIGKSSAMSGRRR